MTDWHLRLARQEDASALPGIERTAATLLADLPDLGTFDRDTTWTVPDLRRLIGKGHCLVAYVADQIVGFLVCEPFCRELHLWEVSVVPQFQQRGIGAGLVRACLIDARNSGFRAVTLTTFRHLPWNGPFYTRMGFVEATDHIRLAGHLTEDAGAGLAPDHRSAMICHL